MSSPADPRPPLPPVVPPAAAGGGDSGTGGSGSALFALAKRIGLDGSGILGVAIMFLMLLGALSMIALWFHSRRIRRRHMQSTAAAAAGVGVDLPLVPPGHRLGVVAESSSGRHLIILGLPASGAFSDMSDSRLQALAAAARARHLLPSGKLPTPQRVIASLPTYVYSAPAPAERGGKGDVEAGGGGGGGAGGTTADAADADGNTHRQVCVICCDEFDQGRVIKLLPCMHSFCAECIDAWLERATSCPLCAQSVLAAAGLSEAAALEMIVAAAGLDSQSRRRQFDGREEAGAWALHVAPGLEAQAQEQRQWQLQAGGGTPRGAGRDGAGAAGSAPGSPRPPSAHPPQQQPGAAAQRGASSR
ncbi:hypothetical protein Rsub_09974 [Raphidocelis subcapitata]|uniref:RING-type domain-containing protein n=1 Tax=Raphidocelis subcapitata TaxID=307507 RepID=A0A2V0PH86_9CHLO|nr:hypothetical protein Rsub_09974 [Raphidocelis subcapitata]|eukprot:GBF97283.1 hypothetical protein Rsub_09974 [Raphidocelis subcapitata]